MPGNGLRGSQQRCRSFGLGCRFRWSLAGEARKGLGKEAAGAGLCKNPVRVQRDDKLVVSEAGNDAGPQILIAELLKEVVLALVGAGVVGREKRGGGSEGLKWG